MQSSIPTASPTASPAASPTASPISSLISSGRAGAIACSILIVFGLLGCAGGSPSGPAFERLAPPDASSAVVYIYRQDVLRGVRGARLRVDGDDRLALRNGEYVAVVLEPGGHRIAASLYWLGLIPRSWNELELTSRGGQTLYVKLWAAPSEIPAPSAGAEVPGRSDDRRTVGIHMSMVGADEALQDLRLSRRAEPR